MSSKNIVNYAASVRQRLYNLAKKSNRPFDEICQYYTIERFIFRLSQSPYQTKLILKGALMFMVWGFQYSRPTRDIDLLGYMENNIDSSTRMIKEVCNIDLPEDGICFLTEFITGELIQHKNPYKGVRIHCPAEIAKAKTKLQIDIGFGDIVHPTPITLEYPTLLNTSSPTIYGYTPETLIAEKVHTMLLRGMANSRIKDYFDVWFLSKQFEFQGNDMLSALKKTLTYRGMSNTKIDIDKLLSEFSAIPTKKQQWDIFVKRVSPFYIELNEAIKQIQTFIMPIFASIQSGSSFNYHWHPSSTWKN